MVYPRKTPTSAAGGPAPTGDVPAAPSFPAVEEAVLRYWAEDGTFRASIAGRPGTDDDGHSNEFVFYDGPPFANGLPHYGHLLTGYVKDIVPRYQTMLGHRVDRRFGWDTHGLPAELEAMKQLGLTEKSEIEAMGIDTFNAACRSSVLKYTREWRDYVTRQARWVDFDHDYKSLDVTFMESVLWAFSQLWKKGLAYEGFRVLPYCWKDQTPLSNHELRMDDDVYQPRQDQTVTVTFPLQGPKAEGLGLAGVAALAWTTTPWTLPSNEALAVGPDIDYVVVPAAEGAVLSGRFLLARALVGQYAKELGYDSAEAVEAAVEDRHFAGAELEGIAYERLFDYFADTETYGTEKAWHVLLADYVDTTEGTGVVHQAPAYGEDDQKTCEAYGIPVIVTVDEGAVFLPTVPDFAGLQVFDANRPIINVLKDRGRLLREASYEHSYPHCWRCRTPLIYKAVSSWFVRVTAIKDRMLELNQQINWVPEHIRDGQFGKWLANARDWSISRNRYWGSPIPVWKSDDPAHPRIDVYGSLAQLEADFGRLPRDEKGEVNLHRPYIDELTRPNPDDPTGRSTMRRIPDVLDVWFDSGSMPYAQVHYPFENQDWFDTHNPADFVVEYIGQTRGWFYLLHVLSTALFDRPAFRNVVCHGIVLGNDGRKMSKSLRNYPDVNEVFDTYGSDAMRWYLMSSPVVTGGNLVVTGEGIRDGVRQTIIPLWNAWHFFSLYANLADGDGTEGEGKGEGAGYEAHRVTDPTDVLDRYVLAKLGALTATLRSELDRFDVPSACGALREFVDVLNNWYIRRSRSRFWAGEHAALDTLYTVLETLTRLAAPLLPLVTEAIWQGLTGGRSVHLTDYPDPAEFAGVDPDGSLVASMDRVREVCSAALGVRKVHGLRARQPLSALTVVAADAAALADFTGLVTDEVNVRDVELMPLDEASEERFGLGQRLTVHARVAGPRLGRDVQAAIRGAKSGDWTEEDGRVTAGGIALEPGEYTLETVAAHARTDEAVAALPSGGFVVLDTEVTPELAAEGLARDVIRAVQQARKDAGLRLGEPIRLRLAAGDGVRAAVEANRELVLRETGTTALDLTAGPDGTAPGSSAGAGPVTVGDGSAIDVTVVRA